MKGIKLLLIGGLVFILTGFTSINGQEKKVWSLEDCVFYAHDHNIQVKQQQLNTAYNENTLKQSKIDMAPNLNFNTNYNYASGRVLDQSTYIYKNQDQNSQNLTVSSNVTLFQGLQMLNTVKQNKYTLMASHEDVERLKNDISVNIALAYLQILLNKELYEVAVNQLAVSELQVERTGKLVDAGSIPEGSLFEISAQASREEMQVVSVQNMLDISYLNLTQMLDLDSVGGFEIEVPDLESLFNENYVIPPVELVFSDALRGRPEIRGAEYRLKSSEYALKIAKGGRSPRISLGGNYGTLYSDTRSKLSVDGGGNIIQEYYPYGDQLKDNQNWGIGVGLSIPIFNGWMVNTNVNNSKLNIENYQYELKNTRLQLYKEIQQAHADALAAVKKYRASEKAVTSMIESFRYVEQKYNVGLVNSVDYNTTKNQLTQAQSELLQAKYEYIFMLNVLEFYRGNPIVL